MDHRPSTPGTHIDWAGDDDDTLPDLDDWGVSHADLISPIIVDGLRALPEVPVEVQVPRTPTPPVEVREPTPPPARKLTPEPPRNPLHPSLPAKPAAVPTKPLVRPAPPPKAPKEDTPAPAPPAADPLDDFRRPDGLAASIHAPAPIAVDSSSLAASIHAPRADAASAPPSVSVFADATHTRAHTVGRPDALLAPPPTAPRASRSGNATPVSRFAHARTHSTPPAHPHRAPHARPVLTGAAISRVVRTLGGTQGVAALGGAD